MHSSLVSLKTLLFSLMFSLVIIGIIVLLSFRNNRTKIVFCDVGQGDGTYIRINNKVDILIDAGPNNGMMLSCLGKYMPFFDKEIEIAILSHPQSDHYGGLLSIVDRYTINHLYISDRDKLSISFSQLLRKITTNNGVITVIRAGEHFSVLKSRFYFFWPPAYLLGKNGLPNIKISDDNMYSSVFLFKENDNSILFTGDTPSSILTHVVKNTNVSGSILKVSHHGSKNGSSRDFVLLAHPSLAVISVGRKNSYDHPSKGVLKIFKALNIPVRRTDEEGDIVMRF